MAKTESSPVVVLGGQKGSAQRKSDQCYAGGERDQDRVHTEILEPLLLADPPDQRGENTHYQSGVDGVINGQHGDGPGVSCPC